MFSHETRKILEENEPPKERSVYAKKVPVGFKTGTSYRFRDAWTQTEWDAKEKCRYFRVTLVTLVTLVTCKE